MSRRALALVGVLAALVAGLGVAQLAPGVAPTARASGLVGYSSCADLLAHYRDQLSRWGVGFAYGGGVLEDVAASEAGAARSAGEMAPVGSGPTGTNLQEQGVDEPDLAKLRDGRLVVLTGDRLRVLSADPQPQVLGEADLGTDRSYGGELLLVGDKALVLLPEFRPDPEQPGPSTDSTSRTTMPYVPGRPITRVVLVDLAGDQPREVETATYEAAYVSARLVDGTVRLVTSTQPRLPLLPWGPAAGKNPITASRLAAASVGVADVLPQVLRTAPDGTVLERGNAVGCTDTARARGSRGSGTLTVITMRPGESGLAPTDRTAVTTDGDLVYASADRLYVATSRWGTVAPVVSLAAAGVRGEVRAAPDEVSTELHAFDTSSATATTYVGSGSVPGYLMGRWALSYHDGYLRVATTRQPPWESRRADQTSSMVVKLAERGDRLVETGRVDGLGKTEQIRAVRYFGDIAAVVTFRQTDPLYLLDLSGTPRVLGELKIPGFSTYLHPVGDGRLLGLGQDADENGQVTGVQVSVFDVSDLSRPVQVDRLHLGPGWTPALDDSRAFTFDPDRQLATFVFSGYDPAAELGQRTSALGVVVEDDGSLRELGRIAVDENYPPERVLLTDEAVLAVGHGGVVAGDPTTWTRTGATNFPFPR
jgi:uncharacterized secreted protein with C-terminal beta-propeller domain